MVLHGVGRVKERWELMLCAHLAHSPLSWPGVHAYKASKVVVGGMVRVQGIGVGGMVSHHMGNMVVGCKPQAKSPSG